MVSQTWDAAKDRTRWSQRVAASCSPRDKEDCIRKCPNLLWLALSGCGHITDQDVISVLQSCRKLRRLHLENCVRITDRSLEGVAAHGGRLEEVTVDFCRNITQAGLQAVRERRPGIRLSAERSADMIPDSKPEDRGPIRRTLQKLLQVA